MFTRDILLMARYMHTPYNTVWEGLSVISDRLVVFSGYSTNEIDLHDLPEIVLKVALSTKTPYPSNYCIVNFWVVLSYIYLEVYVWISIYIFLGNSITCVNTWRCNIKLKAYIWQFIHTLLSTGGIKQPKS
jgi:hypothetical protein